MSEPLTIRQRVDMLERLGLSRQEAYMAQVPRLWVGSRAELEAAWKLAPGLYREQRMRESCDFWAGFWSALRVHLEACDRVEAHALLERAIARVEPWPDHAEPRSRGEEGGGK